MCLRVQVEAPVGIFGVPLQESIKYANVAISLSNEKGESYIYGYVPIVVAKCGVFLKEKGMMSTGLLSQEVLIGMIATDVEGIFRLSGSAKRIKELQSIFDSPDRYGKGLDWTGYTVHDAANILRRYLNQLPQPIVPLDFYERFRDPLRDHQSQAVGDIEAQAHDMGDFDHEAAIATYKKLIIELPALNRQLLLYILDLLAVFSSKSEQNRMTAPNLSAIFQPGVLSNPQHDLYPEAYRLSQDVLIFLIENQDYFLVGMSGTEADEKTVKEVQGGVQRQPNTPTKATRAGLGRSASNASAGADSLRKSGGARRNRSVSSKNSQASSTFAGPASPAPGSPLAATTSAGGVYRSNTVPSKKSPGLSSARFGKLGGEPESPTAAKLLQGSVAHGSHVPSASSTLIQPPMDTRSASAEKLPRLTSVPENNPQSVSRECGPGEKLSLRTADQGVVTTITSGTPNKERKGLFAKSPSSDTDTRKDGRQPNKLRKKGRDRPTTNTSAQSSSNSLPGDAPAPNFYTPMSTSGTGALMNRDPMSPQVPNTTNTQASPFLQEPPRLGDIDKMSNFHISNYNGSREGSPAVKPAKSPVPSLHSRTSMTEESELEHLHEDAAGDEKRRKRSRWRISSSTSKQHSEAHATASGISKLTSSAVAEKSNASVASADKPRKSMTHDSQTTAPSTDTSGPSGHPTASNESTPLKERDTDGKEKKGPIGWLKGKMDKAKEEREERKAEKERAKSPPRTGSEHATSKNSLGQIATDATRGRSADAMAGVMREDPVLPTAASPKAGASSPMTTAAASSATPALDAVYEATKD